MRRRKSDEPWKYPAHQASRAPKPSRCGQCSAQTYRARYSALELHLDRPPLSQIGELDALIRKLRTYLWVEPQIYRRKAHAITAEPAPRYGLVLREHQCGIPLPSGIAVRQFDEIYDQEEPPF